MDVYLLIAITLADVAVKLFIVCV